MHINHFTLNTKHLRKTTPNEVDSSVYFVLKRIYRDAFSDKGASFEIKNKKYVVKGVPFDNGAMFTLFHNNIPIVTTVSSKKKNKEVWSLMIDSEIINSTLTINDEPNAPYIADRIEIGAIMNIDAMSWTGDFAKCMGWITLFPEKVRQQRGAKN